MSESFIYYNIRLICHILNVYCGFGVLENYFNNKYLLNVWFHFLTSSQNVYTKLYLFNIFKGLIYFNMTIKFIQV